MLSWDFSSLINIPEEKQQGGNNWEVFMERVVEREKGRKTSPDPTRGMCARVWPGRGEPVTEVLNKGSRSRLRSSKQPLLSWPVADVGLWVLAKTRKSEIQPKSVPASEGEGR